VFIDFEGIDGSGKTTLSNAVAARLKKLGYRVAHAREGGKLQAPAARRIRELTRDAQLLELTPRAELFLNLARDAQQLEEVIRPALSRGEMCIADRYLYSQVALSAGGRGLPLDGVQRCTELASQGLWPDLVILVDVDPDLARLRKRLGKILDGKERDADSRKGLAGAGLAVRAREAFLSMARADPARWLVVQNDDQPLWALEQRIASAVLARLQGRQPEPSPAPRPPPPQVGCDGVEERFFAMLDGLEVREPRLCAFALSGVPGAAAHRYRLGLLERLPELVARGLRGLSDDASWELRAALAPRAPVEVAHSLAADPDPRAAKLREALFARAAEEVVWGLKGIDSGSAWSLRERAWEEGLREAVLAGLAGLDSRRAWEMRQAAVASGQVAWTARSLAGLASPAADALRAEVFAKDRLAALRSTAGADTPYARQIREALFERAAKVVLRCLTGIDAPYAWGLRERAAPMTKEALDSVDAMGCEAAWSLRERFVELWPATAISSLQSLPVTARARALVDRALASGGGRFPIVRNAYAFVAAARAVEPRTPAPARDRPAAATAA